jgi:hypothetical protein
MQFIRSRIAAPRPSDSRSGRTVETAGLVLGEQDLCDFSAAELRVRGGSQSRFMFSRKIDLSSATDLQTMRSQRREYGFPDPPACGSTASCWRSLVRSRWFFTCFMYTAQYQAMQ